MRFSACASSGVLHHSLVPECPPTFLGGACGSPDSSVWCDFGFFVFFRFNLFCEVPYERDAVRGPPQNNGTPRN